MLATALSLPDAVAFLAGGGLLVFFAVGLIAQTVVFYRELEKIDRRLDRLEALTMPRPSPNHIHSEEQ